MSVIFQLFCADDLKMLRRKGAPKGLKKKLASKEVLAKDSSICETPDSSSVDLHLGTPSEASRLIL